jgi:hypothetical protein
MVDVDGRPAVAVAVIVRSWAGSTLDATSESPEPMVGAWEDRVLRSSRTEGTITG